MIEDCKSQTLGNKTLAYHLSWREKVSLHLLRHMPFDYKYLHKFLGHMPGEMALVVKIFALIFTFLKLWLFWSILIARTPLWWKCGIRPYSTTPSKFEVTCKPFEILFKCNCHYKGPNNKDVHESFCLSIYLSIYFSMYRRVLGKGWGGSM